MRDGHLAWLPSPTWEKKGSVPVWPGNGGRSPKAALFKVRHFPLLSTFATPSPRLLLEKPKAPAPGVPYAGHRTGM